MAEQTKTNTHTPLFTNAFREQEQAGKKFLVVPGVPLREQVLNNYLVPAEEIARTVVSWNGTPITINHPKQNNGSVNVPDPDVAIIGHFYNAQWEEGARRMSGEYWIDIEEAMKWKEGEAIIKNVRAGKILETSTGYYADDEPTAGEFAGRPFDTIHRNLMNDHIAILPNAIGACSVRDGCGVNRNVKLNECDCDCPFKNESLEDKLNQIQAAFQEAFAQASNGADPVYVWARKTFDDYLIAEVGQDLFRVNYGRDTEGNYVFDPRDKWQKVKRIEEYVETNAQIPDYQEGHLPRTMLEPYAFNKGVRTPKQIEGLRAHMAEKGIDKAVVIVRKEDGEIKILDGNHRVSLAHEFNIDQIPVKTVNEELQPIDPEMMYREWQHKQDQGYLNQSRESRSSTSTTVSNLHKEPSMKKNLQELFAFLQGKGIKVQQNAQDEFEVEEPTTPPAVDPNAPALSANEIAALKLLASKATPETFQNLEKVPTAVALAQNFQDQEKAEKDQLIASIKTNSANPYSDEELNGMSKGVLAKLNAQMTVSYAGLGGVVATNAEETPLALRPIILAPAAGGK